ncbi:MAG: hypothetical protein AB8B51_07600 [Sedimentitalea sp.]
MQAEFLNTLTGAYPDCLIAAYADIETGVTLMTADGINVPREALDELCAEAGLTLGKPDVPALGSGQCDLAIKHVVHGLFVFLRAPDEPGEAYLFMCQQSIDLDSFLADARSTLPQSISA